MSLGRNGSDENATITREENGRVIIIWRERENVAIRERERERCDVDS